MESSQSVRSCTGGSSGETLLYAAFQCTGHATPELDSAEPLARVLMDRKAGPNRDQHTAKFEGDLALPL